MVSVPVSHLTFLKTLALDDVLRARIKTIRVSEHNLEMEHGSSLEKKLSIYNVGGMRSQVG